MAAYSCPKGHESSEPDFCSECGAKIAGANGAGQNQPPRMGMGPAGICPDCGAARMADDVIFCEVCGYNYATGAHGEIPVPQPAVPPPGLAVPAAPVAIVAPPLDKSAPAANSAPPTSAPVQVWSVELTVDPSLREAGSPPAPDAVPQRSIDLKGEVHLIGRTSQSRGIFPEVAVDHDDAVSHRHALLTRNGSGELILRDIGSSNGTRLNGKDVQALTDIPLHNGDQITLGHWTRMVVKGSA